jgi:hypothetical protein
VVTIENRKSRRHDPDYLALRGPYKDEEAYCGLTPKCWHAEIDSFRGWRSRDLRSAFRLIESDTMWGSRWLIF